jgi:two-component system cell cycle sensor histidine kinase/response regulator CckA
MDGMAEGNKTISGCPEDSLKYVSLFDQSPDGILLIDGEGNFLDFNAAAHRSLGYSREEFARLRLSDIDPVEGPEDIQKSILRVLNEGRSEFEVTHRTRHGELRDVHVITQPITLSGRRVFHTIWHDITERKKTEVALREMNTMLRTLLQAMPDLVFFKDAEGRFLLGNRTMEKFSGLREKEFLGKTDSDLCPPDVAEACKRSDAEAIKSGAPSRSEERFTDKNGETGFLDVVKAPIYDANGDLMGLVGVGRDITGHKRLEDALRRGEEKFRTLFDSATDGLFIVDTEGYIIDVNKTAHERLGYTKEEMLSMHIFRLDHPDFRDKIPERMGHLQEHGSCVCESAHLRKDGTAMPVEINAKLMDYEGKKVFFSVIRDISERKKAEETVRRNEEFMRNVLDNVDEGFLVIDRDFRVVTANKAYCTWIDKHRAEILGRHCYEISHQILKPCYEEGEDCAVKHAFDTGLPHTAMHKHEDAKGNILYVETKAFPLKDVSGTVTAAIETIRNITERHLLEAEQLKTQKLEAIGTLAGGIAHDFNNLLQGVFGYISLAKVSANQPDRSLAALEEAEKALHMSISLTNQLLTFSKGGRPVKKPINLRTAIENAAKFALSGSRSGYRIVVEGNLWQVEADEGQIGQVIQNIVLNADQAMPEGGRVEIWAGNEEIPEGSNPLLPAGGRFVNVVIKDSGLGIPEQYLLKIFDPYFTTKQKGSGLGLATTYSIIRNHGGVIDVRSEVGKGSIFSIYLSACEGESETVLPAAALAGRTGRVLVLDDEETVRLVVKQMLESLGHEVTLADDGEDAIEKYSQAKKLGRAFDVVILDLTVRGGMGGDEAVRRLSVIDPEVKAVVSSGYSDNPIVSEYRSHGFVASLNKPYTIDALRNSLNVLLAQ